MMTPALLIGTTAPHPGRNGWRALRAGPRAHTVALLALGDGRVVRGVFRYAAWWPDADDGDVGQLHEPHHDVVAWRPIATGIGERRPQ
jgi:hypothetical protein